MAQHLGDVPLYRLAENSVAEEAGNTRLDVARREVPGSAVWTFQQFFRFIEMSRPNRSHRAHYRFKGLKRKLPVVALRSCLFWHPDGLFTGNGPKLDNERDNENEHDSEERIPERPRKGKPPVRRAVACSG